MATITIYSDFGDQGNKICHSTFPNLFAMKVKDRKLNIEN